MRIFTFLISIGCAVTVLGQTVHSIHGRVIDKISRKPLPYVRVMIAGDSLLYATTDTLGSFLIQQVSPGIYRLQASCVGLKERITPEYIVASKDLFIEIEMESDSRKLSETKVSASPFRKTVESPISMHLIGLQEIEKSPGANRDISRIVQTYPGVAYTPAGYRNDLMIRGGSPSENRFYLDGIEIPNINHFSTEGASGGPVGIINADLIREVSFYAGAFPADKGNALSAVLDFQLKNGNREQNTYKATLGASEVSIASDGHLGDKTTYLVSFRQSYLQLLFKALKLPFLPSYIDGQFKIKTRFSKSHELTFLGLTGIDNMRLNTNITGEDAEYILSYLPKIQQETFTLGTVYRHYGKRNTQSVYLSHSYLNNRNLKYRNNDESTVDNLMMNLRSIEQKTTLKAENKMYVGSLTWKAGVEFSYSQYENNSFQHIYTNGSYISQYQTYLGLLGWGIYTTLDYVSPNEKLTTSIGLRTDGTDYSSRMRALEKHLSPRISFSYRLIEGLSLAGNAGIYYQLPPYTALGYRNNKNELTNTDLTYMKVNQISGGLNWTWKKQLNISLEGFYKHYSDMPLSVTDQIPLACKGNDYGVIGNEFLVSTAKGRAYGVELLAKWQIPSQLNFLGSFTWYRSQFRNMNEAPYIFSAWDNRFIINISGTYHLRRNWSVGAKLSCLGGAPYTPYDENKSSLVEAWNAQGRPYYDYSRYNTERLPAYAKLDVRVDKSYYFKNWMLGFYIDLQNITMSKLKQQDVLMSTGEIINPTAPLTEQRYRMKYIKQESGTLLPTLGITVEF